MTKNKKSNQKPATKTSAPKAETKKNNNKIKAK